MNPLGVGYKENYGFGYKDLKPFFFKSFDEAMDSVDRFDSFEYWEYNRHTHEKFMDTVLRKGRLEDIVNDLILAKNER